MKMTSICMTYAIPCFMATAPSPDVEIKNPEPVTQEQVVSLNTVPTTRIEGSQVIQERRRKKIRPIR